MSVSPALPRRSRKLRRRVSAATVAAMLAAAALATSPPAASPARATPPAPGEQDQRDEMTILADATAEAIRTGQPVEVIQKRTEDSRLIAHPSGTFSTEAFAQPVHVRQGDTWVTVDPTLRANADGTISPIATPGGLTISGGGTGPLVTVTQADKSLSLTWPHPLPAPTLTGATATYPDVLPDVDLQVIAEPAGGYRERLVVKTAEAAANPALDAITFGTQTSGLTLSARPDGGVNAVDSGGSVIFATDTPLMWDTPVAPPLGKLERMERLDGLATEEPQPNFVAPMDVHLAPGRLTVVPDQELLDNPDVGWPLYIDPNSTPITSYDWTHIAKQYPTQSYWNYDRGDGAKVGHGSGVTYRSYFLFSINSILGKIVTKATFAITLDHSWQCSTSTPVNLYRTDNISRSASVTWKNSVTDTNKWKTNLASASGHANESSCGESDMPMDFASTALTTAVSTAAAGGSKQITFGLRAPDETTNQQWKKFHPGSAKLTVEWNTAPAVPTELTTYPPTACGSETSPTRLPESMQTPTFTAGLSDADANNLTGYLEIRRASDNAVIHGPAASATVPAGGVITWPTIPTGKLAADETVYYYHAWAKDSGGATGSPTARCYFLIDGNDPGTPTITSTDYPPGAEGIDTGTVGTVTINPAAADTDIAGYRYGFDPNVSLWAPADTTGKATIPVTLWGDPFFPGSATTDLYVKAVDKAGNERADVTGPRTLAATDTGLSVNDTRGDINGDGTADVAAVLDMGDGRTAAWTFLSAGSTFHPPTISWDSGINGGHAIDNIETAEGDFDNDGRTDIALFRQDPDGVELKILRSDTNQHRDDWAPLDAGTWKLSDARIVADDFNGDGTDDVAAVVHDRAGGWTAYVYTSTANGFNPAAAWATQPAGSYQWNALRILAGDFDGTGGSDLAVSHTVSNVTTVRVHPSTGSGFGQPGPDAGWTSQPGQFLNARAKFTVANVAGTGTDDIIALYDEGARTSVVVIDTNTSSATTVWDSDSGSVDGWDWRRTTDLSAADFDNDGDNDLAAIVDCCTPGNRELWTFPHTGTGFGTVTKRADATATAVRATTAHWKFGEGNGTSLSDSGDNYPAVLSGATWNTNGHTVGDKAVHFDGVNDQATTGRAVVRTDQSFSIATWVKLDNTTDFRTIASQDGAHLSGFYLQYSKALNAWAIVTTSADSTGSVSYYAAKDTVPPKIGVWTHLAGVYDAEAGQLKLYVNGALRGTANRPIAWHTDGPFQIGKAFAAPSTAGNWWTGDVDDIRVYDQALNAYEVSQVARDATPAGRWTFDTATGPTNDTSGNNRHLTFNSVATGVTGVRDQGIHLDQIGDYATASNAINTNISFTVCAWAKLGATSTSTTRTIASQEGTNRSSFFLRYDGSANRWAFVTVPSDTTTTHNVVYSTTAPTLTDWYHVCGVYDAGTSQIFIVVNGRTEAAVPAAMPFDANSPLSIGQGKWNGSRTNNWYTGYLDDVRIYTGAILDPNHINAIKNGD